MLNICKKMAKTIVTHNGTFHCDDVTACFMIKSLDKFKDHTIIRTRDPDKIAAGDVVLDVGGVFDPKTFRFDHHQHTFQHTIKDFHPKLKTTNPNKPVRLSSAGLVYTFLGHEVITKLLNLGTLYDQLPANKKQMVDIIYDKAYIEFFEEIDGIDNGFEVVEGENVMYNYHISSGISSRVSRYNPIESDASDEQRLKKFKDAMKMVEDEITEGINFLASTWYPSREMLRNYLLERNEVDPSGAIVLLKESTMVGWKTSLFLLEEELDIVGQVKFVLFFENNQWRILAVPVKLKSFESRLPLKKEWRGRRDEELVGISGIQDVTFVHASGFTGGAKSYQGVLSLAKKTLENE